MADDFNIQLQIKIDESQAVVDVNTILKRLEQKINPLMVKLDIDDSKLRLITQQLQTSLQQMQNVGGQTSNAFKSMASNVGTSFSNVGGHVKAITDQLKKDVRQLQDSFGTLKTVKHFEYPDGNKTEMYRIRELGNNSLRTKEVSEPNGNLLSQDITDTSGTVALKRNIEDIRQAAKEQIAAVKEQERIQERLNGSIRKYIELNEKLSKIQVNNNGRQSRIDFLREEISKEQEKEATANRWSKTFKDVAPDPEKQLAWQEKANEHVQKRIQLEQELLKLESEQLAEQQRVQKSTEQIELTKRKILRANDPSVETYRAQLGSLQQEELNIKNSLSEGNLTPEQTLQSNQRLNAILKEQSLLVEKIKKSQQQILELEEQETKLWGKIRENAYGKGFGIDDYKKQLTNNYQQESQIRTQIGQAEKNGDTEQLINLHKQLNKTLEEQLTIKKKLSAEQDKSIIQAEKEAKALQQGVNKLSANQEKRELQTAQATLAESQRLMGLGDRIGGFDKFGSDISNTIKNIKQQLYETFGQNAKVSVIRTMQGDNEVYKYTAQLERAKGLVEEYRGAVDKTTQSIYQNGDVTRNSLSRNLGLMDRLKVAMQNIPVWIVGMTLFWGSIRSLQDGAKYIKELDDAMLDLRKVTDETRQSYANFAKEATVIGSQLKTSSTEVIKATAEFARIGYDLNQAKVLAKEALLYSSVGDVDAKTATSDMVSIIKGYSLTLDTEGKNIRKVVDALNEVGNNYAVTVEGLGAALKRSAASLHEAGNSYQESIAMIVSANAVVQDPEVVGGN